METFLQKHGGKAAPIESSYPGEKMIKHMTAMIKIIKDNKDDCDKIVSVLKAYSAMTDKEKEEYAAMMMKKMEPILKDSMSVMMEVSQKCPEHMAKISAAMGDFK